MYFYTIKLFDFLHKTYCSLALTVSCGNELANLIMHYVKEKHFVLFALNLMWRSLVFALQKDSFPFTITVFITESFVLLSIVLFSNWRFKFKLFHASNCYYILFPVSFLLLHPGFEMGCAALCVILKMEHYQLYNSIMIMVQYFVFCYLLKDF